MVPSVYHKIANIGYWIYSLLTCVQPVAQKWFTWPFVFICRGMRFVIIQQYVYYSTMFVNILFYHVWVRIPLAPPPLFPNQKAKMFVNLLASKK